MRAPSLAPLLLALALAACADDPSTAPAGTAYDLVFDGEDQSLTPYLHRVRIDVGADGAVTVGAPTRIGGGIQGRKPVASPDGRSIVYESVGTEEVPSRLMLLTPGAAPAPLEDWLETPTWKPAWSPDGTRIAFASARDHAYTDIYVGTLGASPAGPRFASVVNLTRATGGASSTDFTPAWSPDGQLIAFTAYRPHIAVWVMRRDGSGARRVSDESGQHGDYFPSWSPDGQSIVFQRNTLTALSLGVVSAAGGTARMIPWPTDAATPAWSPDGRFIAFSGGTGSVRDIHLITPDGTPVAHVTRTGRDLAPAWVPRGAGW